MKVCSKCKIEKELTLFTPRKDRPWKTHSHCRACQAKYAEQRRIENPHIVAQTTKNWRIKNRDKEIEMKRLREKKRMSDPEKYEKKKKYNREYRRAHPIKHRPAFEQWDNVMYEWVKYKVLWVVHWHWFKLRKYWLDDTILVIPKKHLTILKPKLLY